MLNNKFDIQLASTQIKTSTAASTEGPGGGSGGGGDGGGTNPPGGGIVPTLLDCPPYFSWDAFKDENGNPVLRPPSQEPPHLTIGNDWDGDGRRNNPDEWWWFPQIDPPHPNDRYAQPNPGRLRGYEEPLLPDPDRPEQHPDLEGTPSYYDENGDFLQDKYNEDYKFWEELYNPNNPLYSETPGMFPNGWPCWRCNWLYLDQPEEVPDIVPIPGPGGEWTPGISLRSSTVKTRISGSKRYVGAGIDCDEFRKKLEDYLRRTGQGRKRPTSSRAYGGANITLGRAKWKYKNCLSPTQGTRHPDAPPVKLSDYPWWGKPWHELTPEQRELIPGNSEWYQYCSTFCKTFNPNLVQDSLIPTISPPIGLTCSVCENMGNETPAHPMKPPRSPYTIPENGTSVPSQYQEGESVGNPPVQIPTGSSPTMIPSDGKWKYFDDWGGWWELEMPNYAPPAFQDPIPGWFPNGIPDFDYEPPSPGKRSGYPDDVFSPYGPSSVPGYPVPCTSSEWSTPIATLPENTNGPFGMSEIIGPNGNPIESTDTIYQSNDYIVTEIKQKSVFSKIVPTILGNYINTYSNNSLILLDKNINNYNKKMNALYKWRNRFSQ